MIEPNLRTFLGLFLIFLIVIIWVSSSFLVQLVEKDKSINKPFFITYFNNATFTFYLVIYYFKNKFQNKNKPNKTKYKKLKDSNYNLNSIDNLDNSYNNDNNIYNSSASYIQIDSPTSPTRLNEQQFLRIEGEGEEGEEGEEIMIVEKYSVIETFKLSAIFSIIWFLSNYFQNASLSLTNVSSSTILSSTSGLFTLIFGVLAKIENFNYTKCAGVLISLFGVIFVSKADHNPSDDIGNSPILGDILSLCGSILYGLYTVLLKKKIPNEDKVDTMLFFGFVGLINTLCLIPLFPIFHFLGIESFSFVEFDQDIWKILLVNAFIGSFISDCLWLYAVLLTSAVIVTVGISLTIPFALIGDIFFKGVDANAHHFIGAALVILGFLFVNFEKQIQKIFRST